MITCNNDECEFPIQTIEQNEINTVLGEMKYCHYCENEFEVTVDNIYVIYERVRKPNVPEEEIQVEILKRLNKYTGKDINFNQADSLTRNVKTVCDAFYCPNESAYERLVEYQKRLDGNFENTTEQGNVLEELVLEIFKLIEGAKPSNKLRTYTNQFDCTILINVTTKFPSVIRILEPYFIVECKNEQKTPSNTYFHKLSDIMSTNDAKLGIVCSRKKPSTEDMQIAYQQYLVNKNIGSKYLISFCDDDLDAIIKKRVNLLEYLNFKIMELTTNGKNATYEMFELSKSNEIIEN